MRVSLVAILAAVAVSAAAASAAPASLRSCGSLTVGATAIKTSSSGAGATCMLAAFRGCVRAVYRLSTFGVDTIGRSTFTIVKGRTGCSVTVASTFQVVPQPAKAPAIGHCGRITRAGTDIVATGCRGGSLTATESLTGRHAG